MRDHFFGKLFILIAIILFSIYSSAAISVSGGSFESGGFASSGWTVAQDPSGDAVNPLDQLFVSIDGNTFTGFRNTYDLNSFEGNFEVAGIEFGGCAATFHMALRFGSSNGIETEAQEHIIIAKNDPNVPIYKTYPNQICGTSPTAGNLAITLLSRQPPTTNFGGTRITHTSQQVGIGDVICVNTQAGKDTGATCEAAVTFDSVELVGHTLAVTEPVEPIPALTQFEIRATVFDVNSTFISVADVNFLIDASNTAMTFSNGAYRITVGGLEVGSHDFNVISNFEGATQNFGGILLVERKEEQYLTITLIENIASFSFNSVDFIPSDDGEQIIWSADSNSNQVESPEFVILNDNTDGRQYFIFTSSDGIDFAFDDTLTFGSDETNPIQKIWDNDAEIYEHSFFDSLAPQEKKFYKLTYKSPFKHFFSIKDSPEWNFAGGVTPSVLDTNTFDIDQYTVSGSPTFNNLRSVFLQHVPDVFDDETAAFELQFTAHSDINGTQIEGGQTVNGVDSVTSVTLTSAPHRFSFTISATDFESQAIIRTNASSTAEIFITDYAIVARAFFTKRLKVFKANTDPLDVFLFNNLSTRFLQEGSQFRIDTEAYDREGVLKELVVESLLDGSKVKGQTTILNFDQFDQEQEDAEDVDEQLLTFFNLLQDPIVDLNGNALTPFRQLVVQARLTDVEGKTVATQSRQITFIQYPFFPNDLVMDFFPTEKRLGKHPKGILQVTLKDPSVLEGFDFRIFSDGNTVDAPNFRTTIFKDQDFTCVGSSCNIQIEFDEYVFEDVNLTTITTFALLNTEILNQNNLLTRVDRRIFVTPIEFTTSKIYQVVERLDRTYRNDEEIQLVLLLSDSEASNLFKKINVTLSLQNCDANVGGNCVNQTIKYKPTGFIFDDKFNINLYFFRHLFILDNGSLLPDGNFISFRAIVTDQTGSREVVVPVLADKCQDQDYLSDFVDAVVGNPIGFWSYVAEYTGKAIDQAVNGCAVGKSQFNAVTTTENTSEERRLFIDIDHVLSSPSQEAFLCLAPNNEAIIGKPLEQDFVCVTWYEVAEKPLDDFRFRITNNFSDLSVEGSTKQYKEFDIPFELIAINDTQLLRKELEVNQNTTIETVGDFFFEGFRNIAKGFVTVFALQDKAKFLLGEGLVGNVGIDLNFNQAFSPATVQGVVFYRIKGIPITNVQQFKFDSRFDGQFEAVNRKNFLEFMALNNITLPQNEATLEVIVSDFLVPVKITDNSGSLIVDEVPTNQQIDQSNLDENASRAFSTIPNFLSFTLQNTMFFNNFTENDTRTVFLRVAVIIREGILNSAFSFADDFTDDPFGTITDVLFGSIFIIAIIIGLVFMYSLIRRNLLGGGNGGGG